MSTIEFGDFVEEDAVDTETPDATATARIYQNYRSNVFLDTEFNELTEADKNILIGIFRIVIPVHYALTADAGASLIVTLRYFMSSDEQRWSQLSRKNKAREIAVADYILKRLARETGHEWERD